MIFYQLIVQGLGACASDQLISEEICASACQRAKKEPLNRSKNVGAHAMQAFYARARLLHPDKGGGSSAAAFARCQEAMHVLSDARSRQVGACTCEEESFFADGQHSITDTQKNATPSAVRAKAAECHVRHSLYFQVYARRVCGSLLMLAMMTIYLQRLCLCSKQHSPNSCSSASGWQKCLRATMIHGQTAGFSGTRPWVLPIARPSKVFHPV